MASICNLPAVFWRPGRNSEVVRVAMLVFRLGFHWQTHPFSRRALAIARVGRARAIRHEAASQSEVALRPHLMEAVGLPGSPSGPGPGHWLMPRCNFDSEPLASLGVTPAAPAGGSEPATGRGPSPGGPESPGCRFNSPVRVRSQPRRALRVWRQ